MKKKVCLFICILLFLSACTRQEVQYDPKNYVDYYLMGRDFSTLNPLISSSGSDLKVIANIDDGMVETDECGKTIGALAESWEHSTDYQTWTFHLKDALWSTQDGQIIGSVMADDFVYAANYVLTPEIASSNAQYLFLLDGAKNYYEKASIGEKVNFEEVGIKALDDKTVQYTLAEPCPYFLSALGCHAFYPISKRFVMSLENPKGYGSTPDKTAYSGAFLIQSHSADSSIELVKNPNYWDADRVEFDLVTLLAFKDEESIYEYFLRGETSVAPLISTQVISEKRKGNTMMLQEETGMLAYGLLFNSQTSYSEDVNQAMNNEDFRQSIFYGFDRLALAEMMNPLAPKTIVNQSFCPKNFITTSEGNDYTTLGSLKKYHDMDLYQPELALDHKRKAKDSLMDVSFPVHLKLWSKSGDTSGADRARMVKEILEGNLGSDYLIVDLCEYSTSFAAEARSTGDYAIAISGWNPDFKDPISCLSVMKSDGLLNHYQNPTVSGITHFYLPEFDAMLTEANKLIDLDQRYEAFANAEAYLLDHAYYCPLYVSGGTYHVTTANEYTRMHSQVGIDLFKYKGLKAYDHAIAQDENETFKKNWEQTCRP